MSMTFDVGAITTSAANLGSIMADMTAFTAAGATVPQWGNFDAARWLGQIVQNRHDGVLAQTENLRAALQDMADTLRTIANNFTSADGENAAKIAASIAELEANIAQLDGGNTPVLSV